MARIDDKKSRQERNAALSPKIYERVLGPDSEDVKHVNLTLFQSESGPELTGRWSMYPEGLPDLSEDQITALIVGLVHLSQRKFRPETLQDRLTDHKAP
jgi:hypothetical protein